MNLSEARSCHRWAYETFGGTECGDRRRIRRLVAVAGTLASRPAGTVTEVFDSSAEREGAYRLLSNGALSASELTRAMCDATARQCASLPRIYIAVDGSSLALTERTRGRGLGCVGAWKDCGRGLQVITALAMSDQGISVGVLAQTWWARTERSPKRRPSKRKLGEKETRFMLSTVDDALQRAREQCPDTLAIAVMDRGFDCWPILRMATDGAHFVLRAKANRRLLDGPRGGRRYLHQTLCSQPVRGSYDVLVPKRGDRAERVARMHVRTARVTIELRVSKRGREHVTLNAVLAREVGGPKGASLSWCLLTTEPIDTFEQAIDIVRAYSFRWRIEELHRAWKRGDCNVEDTQLRSRDAIIRWATLHVAVAARAVRLAQLARSTPEAPASQEFAQVEIDAAIALRKKHTKLNFGDVPPLGDFVRMVADLGGYTGKSSGGPPGPTVIARGLERLGIAAQTLEAVLKK